MSERDEMYKHVAARRSVYAPPEPTPEQSHRMDVIQRAGQQIYDPIIAKYGQRWATQETGTPQERRVDRWPPNVGHDAAEQMNGIVNMMSADRQERDAFENWDSENEYLPYSPEELKQQPAMPDEIRHAMDPYPEHLPSAQAAPARKAGPTQSPAQTRQTRIAQPRLRQHFGTNQERQLQALKQQAISSGMFSGPPLEQPIRRKPQPPAEAIDLPQDVNRTGKL